jgi:serine/threonine protein kinase
VSAAPREAFGQYLVYEQLGSGGMARVDRAELAGIEGFHRQVALKRMLPHVATNEEMVKAFVREARLASHLRHGNVAQTYDLGKVDGIYFIAMELVTGHTLRAVLKHCAQTTGPMPVPIALNILNQICDALDYAHNLCDETGQPLGIIHRDVSPSNIIVDEAGVAKLIDFGIAKASAAGMQTMSGTIKGKFGYMAPEYLLGRIDARADLFAVGVIAHELLTNRPLFSVSDDMQTLRRVRGMPIVPPSRRNANVPAEIDDIVMTALSRDPDRRWQHATALRTALTTLTKRLGMVCTNQQVVEWIGWALEQTKPHGTKLPAADPHEPETPPPSVQIEQPTRSEGPPGHGSASSQKLTLMVNGPPEPPTSTPIGTPAHSITAQPSASVVEPHQLDADEYRAAVAAYALHEGLPPAPRPSSDHVPTAMLRPVSDANRPALEMGPGARARSATDSSLAGPPARASAPNVTLLDGAAALRSRSASQCAAPPPSAASSIPPAPAPIGSQPPQALHPRPVPPQGPMGSLPPASLGSLPPQPPQADHRGGPMRASAGLEVPLAEPAPERKSSAAMVVVWVLLAAGLAAAGVYLVLPHLT